MRRNKTPAKSGKLSHILSEARRNRVQRAADYRDQALKLFPWVCGRCGREFEGKKLQELTVHHKDHDHDNNPPDGSNWELLCTYCHEMEHAKYLEDVDPDETASRDDSGTESINKPFAGLQDLLKEK